MIYTLKIKLESPMLGQTEDGTKVKRFERSDDPDYIILNNDVFKWAVEESLSLLRLDQLVSPSYLVEILPVKRPTLVLYNRKYKDKITTKMKEASHEAVRSGAVITLDVLVLNKIPKNALEKNLRAPTEEEIRTIFTTIGKFFSLSPWGSYTGKFGRYKLLEFGEKTLNNEST